MALWCTPDAGSLHSCETCTTMSSTMRRIASERRGVSPCADGDRHGATLTRALTYCCLCADVGRQEDLIAPVCDCRKRNDAGVRIHAVCLQAYYSHCRQVYTIPDDHFVCPRCRRPFRVHVSYQMRHGWLHFVRSSIGHLCELTVLVVVSIVFVGAVAGQIVLGAGSALVQESPVLAVMFGSAFLTAMAVSCMAMRKVTERAIRSASDPILEIA